ncbi:8991_t:CDS:2 [Acaulospora morrowiae]|uniref:8991_t:CDS:1 n=1 Tax=Acaulospora morrowiae TaxID=94023 RepID=A0A9N9BM37_9GLOM|nr:8991_t:CDS:2 [Acaulospora morrowiae]
MTVPPPFKRPPFPPEIDPAKIARKYICGMRRDPNESWKNEPSEVKDYYKHLATLTKIELCNLRRLNEIRIINYEGLGKRHQHEDEVSITKVPHFERQTPALPMEENNIDDEGWIPVAYEPIGNEVWAPILYKPLMIFRCAFHEFLDCPCQNNF